MSCYNWGHDVVQCEGSRCESVRSVYIGVNLLWVSTDRGTKCKPLCNLHIALAFSPGNSAVGHRFRFECGEQEKPGEQALISRVRTNDYLAAYCGRLRVGGVRC